MLKKVIFIFAVALLLAFEGFSQIAKAPSDILMVVPFENKSGKVEFNWVGESFAGALTDLLTNKGVGIVTNAERKVIQQEMNIPLSSIPSVATSIRIAKQAGASLLVLGSYDIPPIQDDTAIKIYVKARVILVKDGRILGEDFPNGRRLEFYLEDALGNLQTIHGQLARETFYLIHRVLYKQQGSEYISSDAFLTAASKIPAKAFEAYIKGLLTSNLAVRENYFKNALRHYADNKDRPGEIYSSVALELGHLYLTQSRRNEALDQFRSVLNAFSTCRDSAVANRTLPQCGSEENAEAAYYLGWIFWQNQNYEQALGVLSAVQDLKVLSINNLIGAVAIQAARAEKKETPKAADFLTKAIELLKQAQNTSPRDLKIRFNYGLALFLNKNYMEAATQFREVLVKTPGDGEAAFLAAKAFEILKDHEKEAASADDSAKRHLTDQNRYAKLQQNWLQSQSVDLIQLRIDVPSRNDFVDVIFVSKQGTPTAVRLNPTQELIAQAKTLYAEGKDDEAVANLRRITATDPMIPESYLLLGKIYLRRGEIDQAIAQFRTSIFWDNKMIESFVNLAKIYVTKGECLQAINYAAQAEAIDPKNSDVQGLPRMIQKCSK